MIQPGRPKLSIVRQRRLTPIYRKPRTTIPAKGRRRYPYLLHGMTIGRPNQVSLSAM